MYDELASGITDSLRTREEQQELAEAVSMHARSSTSPDKADGTGARDQRHYWFHNYMPDWMWAEMLDRDVSVDKKLATLAVHAVKIVGCTKPCEKTSSNITSIPLATSGVKSTPAEAK